MSKASTESERRTTSAAHATSAPLRWGIAGYGDVVQRRVAPAIASIENATLACFWGRNLARSRQIASRYATIGTDSFDDLCQGIQALYVATPVNSHLTIAMKAAAAGCHVLIEKPLGAGMQQAGQLGVVARSNSVRVGVAYYRRLMPAIRWLKERIDAKAFGEPRRAMIRFSMPFAPSPADPMAWRYDRAVAGGGVLSDAGSHRMDLLSMLFGRPTRINAAFDDLTQGGCERSARVRLSWEQFHADLDVSWSKPFQDRFELEFEEASLVLDPLDKGTIEIREARGQTGSIELPGPANPHEALIRDFQMAIGNGRAPVCDLFDGLFVDRMLIAAARSDSIGCPVELEGPDESTAGISTGMPLRGDQPESR